jgi:indole-3-glycerol phosphate synthase
MPNDSSSLPDVLVRICANTRMEVAARKAKTPVESLRQTIASRGDLPRGFGAALKDATVRGKYGLIAEIKKASPSGGLIRSDFDPASLARAYRDGGAACLSVLTDTPNFQGADAYLQAARAAVALPCLRKEFLVDPWQVAESRALGADAILVILAMVDDSLAAELIAESARLGMDALVEVHDEAEMARAAQLHADLIGVNNRDLRTFVTDLAVTGRLADSAPANALLVTESGISSPDDTRRLEACGARAMLVGESLMRQQDVEAATRALLGVQRPLS